MVSINDLAADVSANIGGQLAKVVHGSDGVILIGATQIGLVEDITFAINGKEEYMHQIGSPHPADHRVSEFKPKGTFKRALIDALPLLLASGFLNGDVLSPSWSSANAAVATSVPPTVETLVFPYRFDLHINAYRDSDITVDTIKVVLKNCTISNAEYQLTKNEFSMTDVTFIFGKAEIAVTT